MGSVKEVSVRKRVEGYEKEVKQVAPLQNGHIVLGSGFKFLPVILRHDEQEIYCFQVHYTAPEEHPQSIYGRKAQDNVLRGLATLWQNSLDRVYRSMEGSVYKYVTGLNQDLKKKIPFARGEVEQDLCHTFALGPVPLIETPEGSPLFMQALQALASGTTEIYIRWFFRPGLQLKAWYFMGVHDLDWLNHMRKGQRQEWEKEWCKVNRGTGEVFKGVPDVSVQFVRSHVGGEEKGEEGERGVSWVFQKVKKVAQKKFPTATGAAGERGAKLVTTAAAGAGGSYLGGELFTALATAMGYPGAGPVLKMGAMGASGWIGKKLGEKFGEEALEKISPGGVVESLEDSFIWGLFYGFWDARDKGERSMRVTVYFSGEGTKEGYVFDLSRKDMAEWKLGGTFVNGKGEVIEMERNEADPYTVLHTYPTHRIEALPTDTLTAQTTPNYVEGTLADDTPNVFGARLSIQSIADV